MYFKQTAPSPMWLSWPLCHSVMKFCRRVYWAIVKIHVSKFRWFWPPGLSGSSSLSFFTENCVKVFMNCIGVTYMFRMESEVPMEISFRFKNFVFPWKLIRSFLFSQIFYLISKQNFLWCCFEITCMYQMQILMTLSCR